MKQTTRMKTVATRRRACAAGLASGFTLIELMITVAIVAIIAAIAYPSYQNYVIRTHRTSAQSCLSEQAQFMERYYTSNLTYAGAAPAAACTADGALAARYTFTTANLDASTYTLSAAPKGPQAKDAKCGTLTIDHTGARGAAASDCW